MTHPAPPSVSRTDWLSVALIFCAGLLAAAQFAKVSLTLDEIGALYNRNATSVAFLVSVVGAVGMVFGVMAGGLVAAIGARRVFLGCLLLGAIASLLQAALPGIAVMTALRVVEGVSHLGLVVAGPPLMAVASSDRDRPVVMALWAMFFGVAFALAAVIFPALIGFGGVPALFIAHGCGLAVLAICLWPRLPRSDRSPLMLNPIGQHIDIYSTPRLAAPGLGFVFYTMMFVALLTFLPGALNAPDLAGTLPLVSLAGTFGAGWMARRIAPDLVMVLGFALTIVFTATLWAGIFWTIYPLFLTMGLIPGGAFALIPYLNATTPDRGRATGAIAQMGNVGTTLGTPIFALALAAMGLPGLYAALLAFGLGGIAVVLIMRRRVQR